MKSVLYVRLPCWKIYPCGLISIADYVHKHNPGIKQRIIELSLLPSLKRRSYLKDAIKKYNPDVIAFSWRNIQTFTPHDGTSSLEAVLKYDFSNKLGDKISSIFTATRLVTDFIYQLHKNKSYIHLARKVKPDARIVVGGSAFSCFPEQLIHQLPEGTIGIIGEGERAILKVLEEKDLSDESVVYIKNGSLIRHKSHGFINLEDFTPTDFSYITEIFPEFHQFLDDEIGIQTKRGCPHKCLFCLYNVIDGQMIRCRRPAVIVEDVAALANRYGVKKVWFADSQFIPTKRQHPVVEETLDRLISKKLNIIWRSYIRIEEINHTLIQKMLSSGICSLDFTFTGSQKIIDNLQLNYQLSEQIEIFRRIKEAGFSNQLIKLYMPLNSPGETTETLLETIKTCRLLYDIFGKERVYPWLFFLAVQSGTRLEKKLIENEYLHADYNPLSYNPYIIKKLLYNPPPLGSLIGQSFLEANAQTTTEEAGRLMLDILEKKLLNVESPFRKQ